MAFGPAEGLVLVDSLVGEPALIGYHLLPSVRGELLTRLGRGDEAGAEFARAASLTRNRRERALLLARPQPPALPVLPTKRHTHGRTDEPAGSTRTATRLATSGGCLSM